jgi:S1-C subfamily serine protease
MMYNQKLIVRSMLLMGLSQQIAYIQPFAASPSQPSLHQQHYVVNNNNDLLNQNNDDNNNNKHPLSTLSVTELKHLLSNRGIDFRDCLEKRDLIERLQQSNVKPLLDKNDRMNADRTTTATNKYTNEESVIIQTFKRVAPSVAYITTSQQVQSQRSFSLQEGPMSGAGSGFLWNRQGHVVTNCHVVMSNNGNIAKSVKVKLQGMVKSYDAIVIGVEPEKDIAVLKIPSNHLPISNIIDIGTSDDLQVGQSVLAIGNPFGLDNTLTTGVVSALGRDVQGFGGRKIKGCVQTDGTYLHRHF